MKCSFFQATVVSILLYRCTTWTLTKWMKKKLDCNYTSTASNFEQFLEATPHKAAAVRSPTSIKVKRTKHAAHYLRSRDELKSDVLLWTPSHGQSKAERPARTYIQQLCEDTGCSIEDLPELMNNRVEWWERVRDIRAGGTTRWWDDDVFYKKTCCHLIVNYLHWELLIEVLIVSKGLI